MRLLYKKIYKKYYEYRFGISKEDEIIIKKYVKLRKKYGWSVLDFDFYLFNNFGTTTSLGQDL